MNHGIMEVLARGLMSSQQTFFDKDDASSMNGHGEVCPTQMEAGQNDDSSDPRF